jgi:hypothetical protein
MFASKVRIAVASAAALFLISAPASAGGLFGGCNCEEPVAVAPAPAVSVRYQYVPVTTYVPQPYYVVDRGPNYDVSPVSYTTPSVSYAPGRWVTRYVPGYQRAHYTYRPSYIGGGYRWGGYHRGWHGHRHGYHHRGFRHRHFHHGRHFHGHRHVHGARVHRAGMHRGGLAGGPGRHAGPRRGR